MGPRLAGGVWLSWLVAGTVLVSACGSSSEYGEAAGGLGVAVAATAVNRGMTGQCWGVCSPGYACNRESGLCERGDCDPPCAAGMSCALTPTGTECRTTPTPVVDPFDQRRDPLRDSMGNPR